MTCPTCPSCAALVPPQTVVRVVIESKRVTTFQARYQCGCGFIWADGPMRAANAEAYKTARSL